MSTLFFEGIIEMIGKRVRYEALANYAGNSFFKDSYKIIEENYPLKPKDAAQETSIGQLFKGMQIKNLQKVSKDSLPEWVVKNKENARAKTEEKNG